MNSKIDAELNRQLQNVEPEGDLVEAILHLHPASPDESHPDPEQVTELANQVIKRVQQQTGRDEKQSHVFSNLGYFVVAADKQFIEKLVAQPEIASAFANRPEPSATKTKKAKVRRKKPDSKMSSK